MMIVLTNIKVLLRSDSKYLLLRYCSTKQSNPSTNQTIRVRFAPSPTGMMKHQEFRDMDE